MQNYSWLAMVLNHHGMAPAAFVLGEQRLEDLEQPTY